MSAVDAAKQSLERTYVNLFNTIASLGTTQDDNALSCSNSSPSRRNSSSGDNDQSTMSISGGGGRGACGGVDNDDGSAGSRRFGLYRHPGKALPSADWKNALRRFLIDGDSNGDGGDGGNVGARSKNRPEVFYEDDDVVVVYDGFPKARIHLLFIPKV
jgi:hypothetical protein